MPCYQSPSDYLSDDEKEKLNFNNKTTALLCALTKFVEGKGLLESAQKYVLGREKISLIKWMIDHSVEDKLNHIRTHEEIKFNR